MMYERNALKQLLKRTTCGTALTLCAALGILGSTASA